METRGLVSPAAKSGFSLLHRHDEAVHDVIFALGRVLAHVEIEDRAGLGAGSKLLFARPHFFADELLELLRADFAQAFEARDLRFASNHHGKRFTR